MGTLAAEAPPCGWMLCRGPSADIGVYLFRERAQHTGWKPRGLGVDWGDHSSRAMVGAVRHKAGALCVSQGRLSGGSVTPELCFQGEASICQVPEMDEGPSDWEVDGAPQQVRGSPLQGGK